MFNIGDRVVWRGRHAARVCAQPYAVFGTYQVCIMPDIGFNIPRWVPEYEISLLA